MLLAKKWGILKKKESESLIFTGLEIPRDYYKIKEEKQMDEMYKDIYKKLMTLQWLLRRYQMMNCKEHNIYENRNEGQGRVLALLKIQPEIATKDMAYLLGIKQQSLNELLKKLEKSGYVKRKPSKEDKRVMIVCLTEEGKKVKQKEEEYKEIFDCLTNEELEQFSSYIDRILSSLEEMVGNPLDQEAYDNSNDAWDVS